MEEHKKLNFQNSECETFKLESLQGTYQEMENHYQIVFGWVSEKL
jgi:hypothetical protein